MSRHSLGSGSLQLEAARGRLADQVERVMAPRGCSGASMLATDQLKRLLRRRWSLPPRAAAAALLVLALSAALLSQRRQLRRHVQNAGAWLTYELDPGMMGRSEARDPSPRCCVDEGCAPPPGARVAVVTYIRDDAHAPLLQQLECTLRRASPGLELGLMVVEGELGDDVLALARRLNITLLPVEPLQYANSYEPRYSRNWLKVRALGLTQYHSVLLLDADMAVGGPLEPLFALPVEFAAAPDQSRWLSRYKTVVRRVNGGAFLLRPCAAVEAHMLALLEARPKLRFARRAAEQDFFGWYWRYTGALLPLQWNCMASQCLEGNLTVGGVAPRVVHFTRNKPFHGPQPGAPGHHLLCSLQELRRRAEGQPTAPGAPPSGGG